MYAIRSYYDPTPVLKWVSKEQESEIRAAFERLHARQVDAMAERVAVHYGLEDEGESLVELRTSVGAAALIAQIDARVAEEMKKWEF